MLLIKLADRLHNMRTLNFMPQDKRARIAQDTLDIYAPLAGRMGMQGMRSELEDLAFRYLMPDAHELIMARLEELKTKNGALIARIADELTDQFARRGIKVEVKGRQKQAYSIWRKMERNSIAFEQLSDIYGFRILVDTVADCYAAVGVAHTTWPTVPGRFKDYISTPKQNDYRSIHTTVIGPGSQRVELQIRTHDMHEIAEYGIAAHALYKDATGRSEAIDASESRAYRGLQADDRGAGQRRFGEVPRAHQARTVPGPGVLLHPQGAADRAAARRDGDRLRLRRAHRRRQFGRRRQDQRPHRAADLDLAQRRRSADHALRQPHAAGRLGQPRRHRSRARRDPPRHPRSGQGAIRRPRPPDRRARLRARGAQVLRRQAEGGAVAPRAQLRRRRLHQRRARRALFGRRGARDLSRFPGGARSRARAVAPGESGWFGLAKAANLVFRVPGKGENGEPLPLRGVEWDMPVRFAPKGGAVPGERIVGIRTPGEGITIYPIHSPALVAYDDKPELWLDVRWDLDTANKALYPTQILVTTLNEPGALGVVATTIGENGANIDNVVFSPSGRTSAKCASTWKSSTSSTSTRSSRSCATRASSARSSGSAAEENRGAFACRSISPMASNMDVEAMARRCPRSKPLGLARLMRHRSRSCAKAG